ncbi:retrovirus-related Pol polyprotein from transposon gypsy [Trichonephila clavipes]|nr:retrovirus-related Pol polyprotein from transposon gypsy [Trichonephila clavipes]
MHFSLPVGATVNVTHNIALVETVSDSLCRNCGDSNRRNVMLKKSGIHREDFIFTRIKVPHWENKPGLTRVLYHEIDTEDNPLAVSRSYHYDRVKQAILDYKVDKMLKEGTIIPIQFPYASPVMLCRKSNRSPPDNPEAYRFVVDYRKRNANTKYPRYPLPSIDDLMMNITHTAIMSVLDLKSGYFQLAVNPSDIIKTAFVTKNGTYAFRRMPFGLSGAAPNFQKAIDIIPKPVIGKFVNVYMDDEEIKRDETKFRATVEMKPPRNSKKVSKFLVGDIERLFEEARRNTKAMHEKSEKDYNRPRRDVQIKVNDWFLIATHPLSSATKKVVAKFKSKFVGIYRVLEVKQNNLVIWRSGKRLTVNVDQVRTYHHRKCDQMEIRTGSSESNSSRQESSSFNRVQRISNESQYGATDKHGSLIRSTSSSWSETSRIKRNKNPKTRYKRSRESGPGVPERKIRKGSDHRVPKRALWSNYTTNSNLPKFRKKSRREETVEPSTSGYNLSPRFGGRGESRLAMDMKTQQGGPVRAMKSKGRNYNLYIEERTISDIRNARRRGNQQRKDQERKGASTSR